MRNLIARSVLAASFLLSLQCLQSAETAQEPGQEYAWDCPGSGYLRFRRELLVTTDELAQMMESPGVLVVHVGFEAPADGAIRRAAYSEGHIPGARHLKWSDLKGTRETLAPEEGRLNAFASLGLSPGRRVVLYDTGLGLEAAAAFAALDALGLAGQAALLDGQWVKWVCEGRSVCRWAEEAGASDLECRPATVAVSRTGMLALLLEAGQPRPAATLLDARAGLGAGGAAPGPFLRMSWTENMASLSLPLLKSEAELRRRWASVPARTDHRVVVAGRHWREAAPVYFVAKLLGYSALIFDGSIEQLDDPVKPLERGP